MSRAKKAVVVETTDEQNETVVETAPVMLSPESHIVMPDIAAMMDSEGPSKPGTSSIILEADVYIDGERFKQTPHGLFKYS